MKTNLLWVIGSIGALSFVSLQGCGDDDEPADSTGTSGSSGSTGKGGSGGKAGSTGKGGTNAGGDTGEGGTPAAAGGDTGAGGTPAAAGGDTGAGGTPAAAGGDTGAGGGGGDSIEAVCADYCAEYFVKNCDSDENAANSYTDEDDCNTQCATLDLGEPNQVGDTVYCRLTHAGLAPAGNGSSVHCGHASFEATDICQ